MPITYLDEEPTGKKITFLDEKPVGTSIGDTLQKTAAGLEMTIADIPLALGEAFSGLTKTVPASYYAAKEGLARPDQYSKEAIAAFDTQREYFKQLEQEAKTREAQGRSTAVGEAIRGAGQSLGFTVTGMAPAIAGGAVAGAAAGALFPPAEVATVPIGAIAGGIGSMVASAPVSYRMAGGQFLYDAFKSLEESKGSPLTEEEKTKAYNELLPIAQNTALWEAGPEAVGNAVQLGALKYAFGFGKKAATNVAGKAIQAANETLLKKVGAVAGGQVIELAGETITQTQQGADQAKMEQYIQTGSTAGAPDEYKGLAGAVKAFKEVAPTTLALGAITAGAGGVVKVAGMGGKEIGKVFTSTPKTPEQIAEDNINAAADRVANDLSISPDDTEANNLNQRIKSLSQVQEIRKQTLAAIEPTSREAQTLKLDIAEGNSMLSELNKQLTGLTGLSEPITEVERQQIELARKITEEAPAPEVAPPAEVAPAPVTPQVSETITKPVLMENRNKDLFPETTDFMGKLPTEATISSYTEKNGIGTATYVNPQNGSTDVFISAFGDNDFIAYIRIYDEQGNPTNRFASKLERRTERAGATRSMLEQLQSQLPAGHEYTEDVSASTDGLRFISSQLNKGYELVRNDVGGVETNRIAINGESIVNDLGADVIRQGQEFADIQVTNRKTFERVRDVIKPLLERFNAGLNENNIYWENGRVYVDIPVLRKTETAEVAPTPAEVQPAAPVVEAAPVAPTPVAEVAPEVAAPVEAPAPAAEVVTPAPAPVTPPVSETITEPTPAPVISEATKRKETIALQSVDTPKKLTSRLQDALDVYGIKDRKSWTLDFENKQLVSPDGKAAVRWSLRDNPNQPESSSNQQTTRGRATLVSLATPSQTQTAPVTAPAPTPAVSETITEPTPAQPIQRDVTKPEQMTPQEFEKMRAGIIAIYDESAMPPKSEEEKKAEFKVKMLEGELKRAFTLVEGMQRGVRRTRGPIKTEADLRKELNEAKNTVNKEREAWRAEQKRKDAEAKKKIEDQFPDAIAAGLVWPDEIEGRNVMMNKIGSPLSGMGIVKSAIRNNLPVSAEAVDQYGIKLPEGYVKQGELYVYQPTPAVSETITEPAAPTEIAVVETQEQRYDRLLAEAEPFTRPGVNYNRNIATSYERLKSGIESGSTLNEPRAEELEIRLRKIQPSPVSETITEPTTAPTDIRKQREAATPVPEANRYTYEEAVRLVDSYFDKEGIPEGVVIVNNTTEPDLEMKAGYFVDRGQIVINLVYINNTENLSDIISHELGHFIFSDPAFQGDFQKFWNEMTPEEKAKADDIIKKFYNEETGAIQLEEKQVRAFMQLVQSANAQSNWGKLLDTIKRWINKYLKTNFKVTDRGALAVLAAAHKRFKSGERIVREMESGVLKMAAGREQIMGEEVGPLKETPEGIIAKTKELLRQKFNPSEVTELNTTEAYRALGKLTGKDGLKFAQELNDIGRVVDESGAASEISVGAALFVNDLFEYSIKLAANGDKKMLGIMMTNINKLPTAMVGASDAGRTLAARAELKARFSMMGRAEQDAYINYVAEFIYGPNPTKEQIQSIKDAYAAVDKTEPITEKELTDEIKAVGDRTGTDLVGKINDEFTKATEKKTEQRNSEMDELNKEYKKIQNQADAEIEKLAKIQSDTPSFDPATARQKVNDVRAIVVEDLKQRPDMGRKAPWKSMLVAKLQDAGVELTAAETLADIVWRQHEINNLSRELASINKAIEKGPISEIVKAIKETPLEEQQKPNWRYEVMRDYLRKAGLTIAQSERIAKLMDISLQKRFTMAQEEAFTKAISKTAPWKSGDTRSRRAFQKVLQALRAGALDPSRNVLSDMAALNGWTGFTPEQYKTLLKNDAILSDPESADATKAEAHKAIQDVIAKAKLPIRARDVIGQYYDAQALSGIPTATVNIFSPAGMAAKNAMVQALNGVFTARPEQVTAALTTFNDSIKSWANTVAYSFKNNVTVYSNVEYLVNDEGLLRLYKRGVDQFNNGKTPRERADGVKNIMIGMMDYVRRILNALDYGAIASLQNQSVSKYALAAMQAKGMSSKDGAKMLNAMMEQKRNFYNEQIAIGTDKRKASVLADEYFISSWRQALTDAKLPTQEVMDAALNDAMSAVGRNRQSLDAFREEETNTRDEGVFSFPAIWLLESMANAANQKDNQFIKIFSRVIYGFAIVPARVLRETAWFSPYGAVRFAYYHIAKKAGLASPYAQSLGNDLQYRQRLTETIAGTLVMLAFGAAMTASTDDEDDKKPFKIVVTGNGPLRSTDPQFYDSWMKKNRPNTVSVYFGKTKFTINTMRGFEAFAWPAMMLGAVDDWHIRRKQNRETNNPLQMEDAAIVAGNVLSASLRRGPYAFAAKPLFEAYGDRGVESLAKSLAFPAKTMIPVLGSTLASNISNFLNEPVDRRTLEGALWANVPFIGPAVAPKSLNAFGEPALANDAADKIFKLGVPIVFDIPNDRQSVMLHELILKQGGGPSIPTRNQLAQRLDRQPTNKEYEMFVKEYGAKLSSIMKKKENFDRLSAMKPETYSKVVERLGNQARDIAEAKVRAAAKKP